FIQTKFTLGHWGLIAAIVITALLFDPIKRLIQDRLDQFFDRKRYDYRRTLIEFGRELSSETDLSRTLTSAVDRLSRTLLVDRIAIILATGESEPFMMAKSFGISYSGELDFSFLSAPRAAEEVGHIFFDNTSKAFNENIVESISVGVLAVDLADRVESWNSQMEVMYATPRAQAKGKLLSEIFLGNFVETFYKVRQNPGVHNLYKFRLDTPTGESRMANIAIAPLVTRNFQVVGRLIIVDDITERIALERQLSQAEKMSSIGILAAGVAHE